MGRQENNTLIELRVECFHFILLYFFSELKEEGKDPAQTSILNQAGISFLSFMSGACVSTDNCEAMRLTDQSKAAPLQVFWDSALKPPGRMLGRTGPRGGGQLLNVEWALMAE